MDDADLLEPEHAPPRPAAATAGHHRVDPVLRADQGEACANAALERISARAVEVHKMAARSSAIPLTPYRTALLLHWELDELATYFMELQNQMRQTVEEYRSYRQRVLVVDANTLLHCQRFDKIPWSRVCGKGPATLVIPHVVVEEIDTKSYSEGSEKIRKRARGVYELLGDVLKGLSTEGRFELHDGTEVQVLRDELGHRRLPNNDDEAVARAAHLQQAIAPRQISVITRDNGMRGKAMTWCLPPPDKYLIPEDGDDT